MATGRVSPGVYVNELDFSVYAPLLGLARLCVLGGATKGPIDTPTLVRSEAELVRAFGKPVANDYGLLGAIEFLKKGDQLVFVRVADRTAIRTADTYVPGTTGGTPATFANNGQISLTAQPSDGDKITIRSKRPTISIARDFMGAGGSLTATGANTTVTSVAGSATTYLTGTIVLTALPANNDTVVINDGTTSVTFTFKTSPAGGTDVQIDAGGDVYATIQSLLTAINANAFNVTATTAYTTATFEFDSNSSTVAGNVGVTIGANVAATFANLLTAINGSANAQCKAYDLSQNPPACSLTTKTAGTIGNSTITKSGTNVSVTSFSNGANAVAGTSSNVLRVYSLTPGTWANSVTVTFQNTTTINGTGYDVFVKAPVDNAGTLQVVERFDNLSTDSSSPRYINDVIEQGLDGEYNASRYITLDVIQSGGTLTPGEYALGSLTQGADGIATLAASDVIGTVNGSAATGLKAIRNPERTEFNLLIVPGWGGHKDVIAEIISLADPLQGGRGDFLAILDTPFGLSWSQAVDWHNGVQVPGVPNQPLAPIDSSYACIAGGWIRIKSTYLKKSVWLPNSPFLAAQFAEVDRLSYPWMAAAGQIRGLINGDDIEYSPSPAQRDVMLGGSNRVNPIVNFEASGLTVWGNRTLLRARSALRYLNIRRMMLHIEKLSATAAKYLVFDPNDPTTWDRFVHLIEPVLDNVKARQGLEAYTVICDATTNPPELREDGGMKGRIQVIPTYPAEKIDMDFAIYATGATFTAAS